MLAGYISSQCRSAAKGFGPKVSKVGGVLDLDAVILYPHSEFIAVDKQPDDDVVHLN